MRTHDLQRPSRIAAWVTLALTAACAVSAAQEGRAGTSPAAEPPPGPARTRPVAAGQRPPEGEAGALEIGDPYYPGLGNGGYDVEHYDLDLDLDMSSDTFGATARIRAKALQDLASFSLDLYGLDVETVLVDGKEARFERPPGKSLVPARAGQPQTPVPPSELVIRPAQPLASGATFTTEVRYGGEPGGVPDPAVPFVPEGVGWMRAESGIYVVSECIGASGWFPCNNHPRDKATYSFRITVAKPYTAAANGVLKEVVEQGESRTFVFELRDPMATYLATVNVAEFGVIEATGPRGIPLRIYHPTDATEAELAPFRHMPETLEFLESVFGPYPFEAAGGVLSYEPIPGALECQTLPVYGRGAGEAVVHELAHQWFGDCVSPDLWRDIWLNEGFADYSGWLWAERMGGKDAYQDQAKRAYAQLRKSKTGSPFDPGVERVFSRRVYTRGAMVLHGLRMEVGDETFFRILKQWVTDNRNGNGSTAGFVEHAAKVARRDLKAFFDAWLYSEVTPEVPELASPEPEPSGGGERRRKPGGG